MHLRSARFPERNGGLYPAAHFCARKICISTNNVVFIKYIYQNPYTPNAAIRLFISSHYEIEDFCSMDKKPVAVTDGAYASIQL